MVQVEGIGQKPPAPHDIKLTSGDLHILIKEAITRCEYRGYGNQSDAWGRGHVDGVSIPGVGCVPRHAAPIAAGLVGEYATCWLIDKRCGTKCLPDFKLRLNGDGGTDLSPYGMRLDVKTRTSDYGTFLVRAFNDHGKKVNHNCAAFVFATWRQSVIVTIHGWITCDSAICCPVVDARRGEHTNHEIQPHDLLPMSRLFDEIESRKLWH
jgi:hypothetical protein